MMSATVAGAVADEQGEFQQEGNKDKATAQDRLADLSSQEPESSLIEQKHKPKHSPDDNPYGYDPYWWTPQGFVRRFLKSKLVRYFTEEDGDEVTVDDMDTMVSLFSLIAAFVLAVPFGVITAFQGSTLDEYLTQYLKCTGHQQTYKYTISFSYSAVLLQAVYSSLITVILSLIYFIVRPGALTAASTGGSANDKEQGKEGEDDGDGDDGEEDDGDNEEVERAGQKKQRRVLRPRFFLTRRRKASDKSSKSSSGPNPHRLCRVLVDEDMVAAVNIDFRQWWRRGKFIVLTIAGATIYCIVVLCTVFNMYYGVFFMPLSQLCSVRTLNLRTNETMVCYLVVIAVAVLAGYIGF